jgi:hypothetical protein
MTPIEITRDIFAGIGLGIVCSLACMIIAKLLYMLFRS